jgi:hypothetical protein
MLKPRSRATLRAIALLVISTIFTACASGPTIISNADPSVNWMNMQTFDFMQPLSTDRGNVQSLLSSQMMAATSNQLELRGWRRDSNNPDVLINFLLETQEQIRTRNTSASVSMHRGGRYGMWGGAMTTPTIEQTTQGALSIDMVDPVRNQLIWEGTATHRVTDNIRQNQAEAVESFVAAIFAEFPQ